MAVQPPGCPPVAYQPRRPADTPLYRAVQNRLETFLALCHDDWEAARVTPSRRAGATALPGVRHPRRGGRLTAN